MQNKECLRGLDFHIIIVIQKYHTEWKLQLLRALLLRNLPETIPYADAAHTQYGLSALNVLSSSRRASRMVRVTRFRRVHHLIRAGEHPFLSASRHACESLARLVQVRARSYVF
jgi:hypothetical protein